MEHALDLTAERIAQASFAPDGWLAALDAVAATPFDRVAPGHGPLLTRAGFMRSGGCS